jgi:pyruvate/2-oxoacid:ferredoxin oxidoreductase alpha subunit
VQGCKDAEYLIIAQGSVIHTAQATADYLREKRNIKVGVVNMAFFRPFPGDLTMPDIIGLSTSQASGILRRFSPYKIRCAGVGQLMMSSGQEVADLNIISRKIAELSLNPAAVGQDGFLSTRHLCNDTDQYAGSVCR